MENKIQQSEMQYQIITLKDYLALFICGSLSKDKIIKMIKQDTDLDADTRRFLLSFNNKPLNP